MIEKKKSKAWATGRERPDFVDNAAIKIFVQVYWYIDTYVFLEEAQQPSTWEGNISDSRRYEEEKNIMIFCLSELPPEPSFKGKTSSCGNPRQLQAYSVLHIAASFVIYLIALTTGQQGSTPAPAPSMRSSSPCCPHPHPLHGQTVARKKKTDSLHYTKVLNFCLSKDTFKIVERKARVGKHICITYN